MQTTTSTAILWTVHEGKTRRSRPIATAVTSWDYFATNVASTDADGIVSIPRDVSWREVSEILPGVYSQ